MSDQKRYVKTQKGILAVFIVQNVPSEIIEKYHGFCHDVTEHEESTWMLLYNITEGDEEIIAMLITDLAEVGYTPIKEK